MPPEIQESVRDLARVKAEGRVSLSMQAAHRAIVKWCEELGIEPPGNCGFVRHVGKLVREITG